jgi:hypothetical protein
VKKIKLHQQFTLLFLIAIIAVSCSKKNYPAKDEIAEETAVTTSVTDYTPPPVLTIPDDRARSNRDGELYYDDAYGYRYWRFCDGKYYLDAKYEKGVLPNQKLAKKKTKKQSKSNSSKINTEHYSSL